MDISNIHTRADFLYRHYVDARLWASAELDKNAPLDAKLAFSIGARERGSAAPLLTRSEVRDEIVRLLCSEAKATETPFPNPEKAVAGLLDLEAKVRDALEHALGLADGRPLVDLIKDLAKQRDDIMAECHLRTVSGDGVKLRHDSAYLYSGRWARVCKMLRIDPEQEAPEALRMLRAAERSLASEATVKLDTPFPNPEKAAAGPYTGVDMSAGKSRTVVSILKLDPPEGTTREQMAAALTTPIEPKREPLNRGPWAADLAEQDRRHEELLAAARDLASIDPTNTLLDQPGLLPAHELKLARLRHALAQAARETAGSRTACANRWLSIAATLGIDPGKNPPDDIAGFIDNGGKEALTQQIVREQWKGKGLAQVLFELMIPRRTEPAR